MRGDGVVAICLCGALLVCLVLELDREAGGAVASGAHVILSNGRE